MTKLADYLRATRIRNNYELMDPYGETERMAWCEFCDRLPWSWLRGAHVVAPLGMQFLGEEADSIPFARAEGP